MQCLPLNQILKQIVFFNERDVMPLIYNKYISCSLTTKIVSAQWDRNICNVFKNIEKDSCYD